MAWDRDAPWPDAMPPVDFFDRSLISDAIREVELFIAWLELPHDPRKQFTRRGGQSVHLRRNIPPPNTTTDLVRHADEKTHLRLGTPKASLG